MKIIRANVIPHNSPYPYPHAKNVTIAYDLIPTRSGVIEIYLGMSLLNTNPMGTQEIVIHRGPNLPPKIVKKTIWDKPDGRLAVDIAVQRLNNNPVIVPTPWAADFFCSDWIPYESLSAKDNPKLTNLLGRIDANVQELAYTPKVVRRLLRGGVERYDVADNYSYFSLNWWKCIE